MSADFFSSIADKMVKSHENFELNLAQKDDKERVLKLDPEVIGNWEFRDRQDFELGDISVLAESIISNGQAQPIIVVEANDLYKSSDKKTCKYIVIAGYRRWLACLNRNIKIDAIVRNLTFDQAIGCLVSENEKEQVSDYSKGIFYQNLLNKESISKNALCEKLGIKRNVFYNFLSFAEIPKEVWEAVKNVSKVSARTASTINSICHKGEDEKNAIIAIADEIALGIGEKKITALVNKILKDRNKETVKNVTRVTFSEYLFLDVKKNSIIVTAKNINEEDKSVLLENFEDILKNFIKKKK